MPDTLRQPLPDGLAQAFIFGEGFFVGEAGAMILGDNTFYGNGFRTLLREPMKNAEENCRATVFGYYIPDSERFGVVAFDKEGHVTSIEEKQKNRRVIMRSRAFTSIRRVLPSKLALLSHHTAMNMRLLRSMKCILMMGFSTYNSWEEDLHGLTLVQ